MKRRPIAEAEIEAGRSAHGDFAYDRLKSWGVRCPPKAGWKEKLLRTGVPEAFPYPKGFAAPADGRSLVPINPLVAFSSAAPLDMPAEVVEIYTDGSCKSGAGGWAFAVYRDALECHAACGGEVQATGNRMELAAVVAALRWLDPQQAAILWTDSQYVVRGVIEWRHGRRKSDWSRAAKNDVANGDWWRAIFVLLDNRRVDVRWTRGHSATPGNIRADELAAIGRGRPMPPISDAK